MQGTFQEKLEAAESLDIRATLLMNFIKEKGESKYDPSVTQLEHALQSADLAQKSGATDQLVLAALLHDIGHLLVDEHQEKGDFLKTDFQHEQLAEQFLQKFFPREITAPIQLHVAAKRYLCTVDATYYEQLSEASKKSFHLQGGFLSEAEVGFFEEEYCHKEAVQLRRWDDLSKVRNKNTPTIEHYFDLLKKYMFNK